MKLIVCVKQVPDTSGKVAVNADGTLDRASMQTIINPDDMNAVEAALALKDQLGCPVIAVSMGPPPAAGMLLELKAMGVDKAVLVSAREFGGSDTFATSQILAAAIKNLGVDKDDIIFCGRQAIDGDTAQVGPQIAEKLEIPQVSYVADIRKDGDTLTVRRMLEDGYMTVQVQTPCLLTCIKELNHPPLHDHPGHPGLRRRARHRAGLQRAEGRSPHRGGHHRSEGLSHQYLQELYASPQGQRHDAGGQRQGDRGAAVRHPVRQAHHLRREKRYVYFYEYRSQGLLRRVGLLRAAAGQDDAHHL